MSTKEIVVSMLDILTEEQLKSIAALIESFAAPNAITQAAMEDVEHGRNLSKPFHSVEELMEDLNADD